MSSSKAVPTGHRKEAKAVRSETEIWSTALGNVRDCLVLVPEHQQVVFALRCALGRRAKQGGCRQLSVTVVLWFGRFGW